MWCRLQKTSFIISLEAIQAILPSNSFMEINIIKFLSITININKEIISFYFDGICKYTLKNSSFYDSKTPV